MATMPSGPWIVEPINGGQSYQITTEESTGFRVIAETDSEDFAQMVALLPELVGALTVSNTFLKVIAEELELDDDTCITVRVKKGDVAVTDIATVTLKDALDRAKAIIAKANGGAS